MSLNSLVKEALPYYTAAIEKAKTENPLALPTVYRDPTWTVGRDFAIENGRNAGG